MKNLAGTCAIRRTGGNQERLLGSAEDDLNSNLKGKKKMNLVKKLGLLMVMFAAAFCAQAEMRMEMERSYSYAFGKYGMDLCCETTHDHGGVKNPWSFVAEVDPDFETGIAIPVFGCGESRIKACIIDGSASAWDGISTKVVTDYELAKKMGVVDYWNRFKYEEDDDEYECSVGGKEYAVPAGVWINGSVQSDRQWILISIKRSMSKNKGYWTPISFSVGIVGTKLITPQITLTPSSYGAQVSAKDFFGIEVAFSRAKDPEFSVEFHAWDDYWGGDNRDYLGQRVYYTWDTDVEDFSGGELSIKAPSKGRFYCRLVDDWYPGEWNDIASQIAVFGGVNVSSKSDTDLLIDVSGAGQVKLSNFEEKLCVYGLWFRPDSIKEDECIAVEALFQEHVRLANERGQARYRCYVTGMGVSKFGETVSLVCHPNEGEVFDHWEFVKKDKYGNYAVYEAPYGVDVKSTILTFESTKTLYDLATESVGGLMIVQVRPVLKPRRTIMVVPFPIGSATVSGNGAYIEGEEVAITLSPRKGCTFIGWGDGDTSGPTRSYVVPKDKEMSIIYANFSGMPQFGLSESYELVKGVAVNEDLSEIKGYGVRNLPAGLKFDLDTGMLTGVPTKLGVYNVVFTKKGSQSYTTIIVVREEGERLVNVKCDANAGKASGSGIYKSGKCITLKATANKGHVFSHWEGSLVDTTDSRSPSVTYTVGNEDAQFTAHFIPVVDDVAAISFNMNDEYTSSESIIPVAIDVSGCTSLPKVTVKGLPSGLKFTAKDVYKKGSKTEIEYPADTIYGAPTKSGVYTIVATVTTAGKKTATCSHTIVVRKDGEKIVKAECDAEAGKVTGSGIYQNGKSTTLKATANKGYVFAGWYEDEDFAKPCDSTVTDYRNPSYTYTMGESDKEFYARFVPVASDTVLDLTVDGDAVPKSFTVSGYDQLPLVVESLSLPKISGM